jgi:hypothetical protein
VGLRKILGLFLVQECSILVSNLSRLREACSVHIVQKTFQFHGGKNLEAITTLVQIADKFGHTSAMLTREETLETVADNEGAWIFNGNGQMVQPAELAEANWDTIGTVRIVPGLVGGL